MDRRDFFKRTGLGLVALAAPKWILADDAKPVAAEKIMWTFPSDKPVIRPGQLHAELDTRSTATCHVIDVGEKYRIYYWGQGKSGNVILMAEAPKDRPNDWKARGGVLLGPQRDTEHNTNGPSFPFVFPVDEQHWRMLFVAWGRPRRDAKLIAELGPTPNSTCLALSDDAGLTWRYHDANPVLATDQVYDKATTGSASVVRVGEEYRTYYTARGALFDKPPGVQTGHGDRIPLIGVGYAVSRDGLTWQKPLKELMVSPRGFDTKPYEYVLGKPYVIRDGNRWRMFISTFGPAYRVRSLVSDDGLHWTWVPSGIDGDLGVGALGTFDNHQRSYASVIKDGDRYHLWYTGNGFGVTGMGYCTGQLG